MIGLKRYILESGSAFKTEVKFSAKDFEAWRKETDKKVEVEKFDDTLYGIYVGTKHIGSYNIKKQILMTDDISLFGHYID